MNCGIMNITNKKELIEDLNSNLSEVERWWIRIPVALIIIPIFISVTIVISAVAGVVETKTWILKWIFGPKYNK